MDLTQIFYCDIISRKSNDGGQSYFATLRCGEGELAFGPFSVRVFLRRLSIEMDLGSSKAVGDSIFCGATPAFAVEAAFEVKSEKMTLSSSEAGLSTESLSKIVSSIKGSNEESDTSGTIMSFPLSFPRASVSGSPSNLSWTIDPFPNEIFLKGQILNETRLLKVDDVPPVSHCFIRIPKFGVFTSPSRFNTIREQRRLNIFAILVRKAVAKRYEIDMHADSVAI